MRTHPHFDDRGTLDWHTRYEEALADAKQGDKLVFIEMGRLQCGQCRSLVESVVPGKAVSALLREHFVAVASDADATEDPVVELGMANLPDAMMLPFVLFTDADGNFLDGSSGPVDPSAFQATLERLVSARREA
ncbi:MAG: thioredoxin family protein [Planctomycetota bacterium]|jgi:thioredoxin-related protein